MRVLVTGGAGFIGSHLCGRLLQQNRDVVVLDSFDPYYSPEVKRQNLAALREHPRLRVVEADIRDPDAMETGLELAGVGPIDVLVHLAACVGVRPSIQDPAAYGAVNVGGTINVLELVRQRGIPRFLFASRSSVYGASQEMPFSDDDPAVRPISSYAATKRAGELFCHTYHHLYGISAVCLRLFTVYGPRQRPDMAIHRFARQIMAGEPVLLHGDGSMQRDYTYVTDVLDGLTKAIEYTERSDPVFEVFNLGSGQMTGLDRLVMLIADTLGTEPQIERVPAPPTDVRCTHADLRKARRLLGYAAAVPIEEGVPRFVRWLRDEGVSTRPERTD